MARNRKARTLEAQAVAPCKRLLFIELVIGWRELHSLAVSQRFHPWNSRGFAADSYLLLMTVSRRTGPNSLKPFQSPVLVFEKKMSVLRDDLFPSREARQRDRAEALEHFSGSQMTAEPKDQSTKLSRPEDAANDSRGIKHTG